jgi:thioredoxin-related protein
MKLKISISVLLIIFSIGAFSKEPAWFVNSSEAKVYADTNKVPILLVFAGSDWCKPCKILKADILKSTEFQNYYSSKFALLYLDFPIQSKNKLPDNLKKQNELLAEKYNKTGLFPNLVLINTKGEVLGTLLFKNQTPQIFIDQCEKLLASKK